MSAVSVRATRDWSAEAVQLHALSVRDFRNLARVRLTIPREGLALVGDNGHGKTNLLEAIYYLQLLRSVRGARDRDVVRFGADGFHVAAEATVGRRRTIAAAYERVGNRKKVTVDGVEPARLSDALGALPSVLFSPRDVELVAGAPSERRRFLDVALALTSRRYLAALQHYRAALARRNASLRDSARRGVSAARAAVWEPALAEHGAVLWSERVAWVQRAGQRFSSLCRAAGERGDVRMRYASTLPVRGEAALEAVADALADALASHRMADARRGLTHSGPHRDDLELTLAGHALRGFGSAGQQRTASIALRLLEAATLRGAGSTPLVLLDDPFAELDAGRAGRILELLSDAGVGQTILAVPRTRDIPPEMTSLARLRIVDGVVGSDGPGGDVETEPTIAGQDVS